MEFDVFIIFGFIIAVIAIFLHVLAQKWDFVDIHEKDKASYESACNELYQAIERKDDSFGPALYQYLSAKLALEGVFSWSSWGRSIRMFHHIQILVIGFLAFLFIISGVYWILSSGFASESGVRVMPILALISSSLLIAILIWWCFIIYHCKLLLGKRKDTIFPPEKDMLCKNRKVLDYDLMLLSRLAPNDTSKQDEDNR
jgi:hypothetical protein